MTPNRARTLATAVQNLGSTNDEHALIAARCIARIIEAEGVKPNAFASAMNVILDQMTKPREPQGFADLGPRGRRKRLVELSRRHGITAEDKARVMGFRERLDADGRAHVTEDEIAWIDALWSAPPAARARKPG